jgi:hypothetical protein
MSQAAKDVVDGTFLAKYGDELGNILPKTEQVICEHQCQRKLKFLERRLTLKSWKRISFQGSKVGKEARALQGHCERSGEIPFTRTGDQLCFISRKVTEHTNQVWVCTKMLVYIGDSND